MVATLFAQTTSITGTVADPSGAVVPAATITITNLDTGAQRSTASDSQGRYTIAQVTPGPYKVSTKAAGFAEAVVGRVDLLVNQPATLPLTFEKVGATVETVEVAAAADQVNTSDASIGNAIGSRAIVEMPM
jgi:hypothetical protein